MRFVTKLSPTGIEIVILGKLVQLVMVKPNQIQWISNKDKATDNRKYDQSFDNICLYCVVSFTAYYKGIVIRTSTQLSLLYVVKLQVASYRARNN